MLGDKVAVLVAQISELSRNGRWEHLPSPSRLTCTDNTNFSPPPLDIAKDLLDKRGTIYSARPRLVMSSELTCKGQHILLRQPDGRYLLHQRLEAPVLSPRPSITYVRPTKKA